VTGMQMKAGNVSSSVKLLGHAVDGRKVDKWGGGGREEGGRGG